MIAVILAVVSLLANLLVVSIHALDGSDEVARVQVLSAATSGPLSRAHRMQEKAALISHRIAVRQRRAARAAARAVTVASRQLAAAGQSAPEVDVQPLRLTLEHIDTALPEINPSRPG